MSPSPFHAGERAIQSRIGGRDQIEPIGLRVIHDHLPAQHRGLYGQLPMLLIGALFSLSQGWLLTGAMPLRWSNPN